MVNELLRDEHQAAIAFLNELMRDEHQAAIAFLNELLRDEHQAAIAFLNELMRDEHQAAIAFLNELLRDEHQVAIAFLNVIWKLTSRLLCHRNIYFIHSYLSYGREGCTFTPSPWFISTCSILELNGSTTSMFVVCLEQ